jgi:hypothetical protein
MRKFKVEVLGGKPPRPPEGLIKRLHRLISGAARFALMRPKRSVLAGLVGFVLLVGTPHVGWDYQCRHAVWGHSGCQSARWCAYYGIQGRTVIWPDHGEHCSLLKFLPLN